MHDNGIPKKLIVLLILILTSALVWGDQKKTSAPPPSRPAPAKSAARPAANTAKPMTNVRPANNTGARPMTNTGVRPATNTGMRPMTNTGMRPTTNTGTNNRPSTGMVNKPVTGMNNRPSTGMVNKPVTGMNNRPVTGMTNRPVAGTNRGIPGGPGTHSTMPTRTVSNVSLRGGGTAQVSRRANGGVAEVHANGMTIHQNLHGGRTVVVERNDRTIVTTGHGGYVQRTYIVRGGNTYYQRTYVYGGRTYVNVYRGYYYHGARFYGYTPFRFYHPLFYGWCYNPWVAPVYYSPVAWGWAGAPWWRFYHGFFTPYPVYATASLWLTDYLIAANLQAAYQAQAAANVAEANAAAAQAAGAYAPPPAEGAAEASAQTPLTPEIKQAIADEVQRQLAAEQAAAAAPQQAAPAPTAEQAPDALNPAERVFVVSSALDVAVPASGQECSLTAGDVVMRLSDTPDANQTVTASIQSTKTADCPTGQTVAIGVQDLQEMHNQFQAQLDTGLKTLADKGGTGGLPKPPDTATTGGEVPPPAPDSNAAAQLAAQQQQANQTVAQVSQNQ